MSIWAIADLHLSFGTLSKKMDVFGKHWINHTEKIREHWEKLISKEDLVLVAGDISWALKLENAKLDLDWIEMLPGTKVMIRGNHDYWWESPSKMKATLPPSLHFIQNNAFQWQNISIGGSRLWDTDEYHYNNYIDFIENPTTLNKPAKPAKNPEEERKIFDRELERLELSLKCLDKNAEYRIAMTHYPPIGPSLEPSKASKLLEKYRIDICVFGHLHNVKKNSLNFDLSCPIKYRLTSADYLDFCPIKLL